MTSSMRPPAFVNEGFFHTYNGMGGRFFDSAQNDRTADHTVICVINVMDFD